jgi:RNA polymerase sigma factor (sigma-70 family)
MNPADIDPLADIPATPFDERKPALTIGVTSLSQTVRAAIPSKTMKYDTTQAVEEFYRKHAAALRGGEMGLHEKVAFAIYSIYRPRVIKIARKYRSLSPIFGEDDLQQEALIAILQALRKYKHSPDIRMKFSTYLEWSIRNIFQRAIGNRDKYVEIYGRDGSFDKTMNYGKFIEQKKSLEDAGCTYTTKKRLCYLSEILPDEDLEAKLNQPDLAPYEYGAHSEFPEEHEETQEDEASGEEAEDESHEEPEIAIPGADSGSDNGLNHQMIDGLYRQWVRSPGQSGVLEDDPIILRIYDLCREYGEEMFLPFRNNGTSIDAEEVRRCVLSAIVDGLAWHDNDSVPNVPFSLSLRVSMKRCMEAFRKRQHLPEKGGVPPCVPER